MQPDWSPDGRQIVFTSGLDGGYNIMVMDTNGQNWTRLTNHPINLIGRTITIGA